MGIKYIDLFSGAGGMSIGIKSEGGELLFSNEIDSSAALTQRENLKKINDDPQKVIQCSIEELHEKLIKSRIKYQYEGEIIHEHETYKNLYKNTSQLNEASLKKLRDISKVDLIVGGPPCQGFSSAGRGKKSKLHGNFTDFIDDPRNQLFKYFLEFVNFYSPKAVIIENVKGLATAKGYRKLIENSLENTGKGYKSVSLILNTENFGIPQKRERIFFIGIRNDLKDAEKFIFYLPSLLMGVKSQSITLKEAISDLPQIKSNPKPNNIKKGDEIPIGEKDSFGENISTLKYSQLIKKKTNYVVKINNFKKFGIKPAFLFNHKARYNNEKDLLIYSTLKAGLSLTNELNKEAHALCKYSTDNYGDKYYKLDPNKPSRTIVAHLAMDNNGYVHYGDTPRGITPREAARIQSFPDWYEFKGSFSNQFKQIGNAVPPLIAKTLFAIISDFINGDFK